MSPKIINNIVHIVERFREHSINLYTVRDAICPGDVSSVTVIRDGVRHWVTRRADDLATWHAQRSIARALSISPAKLDFNQRQFRDLLLEAGNRIGE